MDLLNEIKSKRASRRSFMAGVVASGAATALAGCTGSTTTPEPVSTVYVDADYLNFALNLEYLEASFYLYAATGSGLPTSMTTGTGTAGTVTPGSQLAGLNSAQQNILNEIAFDELSHVKFLRAALGTSAVAIPAINVSAAAFAAAATAATVSGGASFTPYSSFANFLLGAFIFEDVGVTAYSGAAPALTSAANLNYAAGIQAVEAYHAAYVRTTLTALGATTPALITAANQISALRSTLGGGMETTLTTVNASGAYPASGTSIVAATTANAIAFARSPNQVLHIVYGTANGAGVKSGLFFPSGLNGTISVTTS